MRTPEQRFWRKALAALDGPTTRGGVSIGRRGSSGEHVTLDPELRSQHVYILGRSGYGKSSLMRDMIRQDLRAGNGLALLTPDDEEFRDHLLPSIPKERWDDVVYFDPEDPDFVVPLNPLHLTPGEDLDAKTDETVTALLRMAEDDQTTAIRMRAILRNAVSTLTQIPGSTLLDVDRLIHPRDASFRTWAAAQIPDERERAFWTMVFADFGKDAYTTVATRLDRLLKPRRIRNLLCTPGTCFDFRSAMDSGKILLFRLSSKACGGSANAAIVGQLVIGKLQLAALSRDDTPREARRPFYIYVDEFQKFAGTSLETYKELFERSRKFLTPLTIAHLHTRGIPGALVEHIIGTVTTYILFQLGRPDARRLSRELVYRNSDGDYATISPESLGDLPKFRAYARVEREVHRLHTPGPGKRGKAEVAQEVMRRSRERYAVSTHLPKVPGRTPPAQSGDQQPLEKVDPGDPFA
jgi:hypothetical protein